MKEKYPYICKDHPEAPISHTWDEDTPGKGKSKTVNERFECSVCGKQLAKSQSESSCFEG